MTTTKPRIYQAFEQFRAMQVMDGGGDDIPKIMYIYFKDAIEDNLPKQISVEAVRELMEKYKLDLNMYNNIPQHRHEIERFIKDLDALLPKQTDGN